MSLIGLSTPANAQVVVWGDSTVAGSGGTTASLRWTSALSRSFTPDASVVNQGGGGESPEQVFSRCLNQPAAQRPLTQVIWGGRLEWPASTAATHNAALDAAVASLGHSRFVVLTPGTGEYVDDYAPDGAAYSDRIVARDYVLTTYPSNSLDINQIMIAANDGSEGDLLDVSREIVPRSLRFDVIHNNNAGHALIAASVGAFLVGKGWLNG